MSIIVLNWNGCSDTIECIESLKGLNYSNYENLIVDNGSTDRSEEILRKKFPELSLIQTGTNLGFAGGANTGIRHALKGGTDYITWKKRENGIFFTARKADLPLNPYGDTI